MNILDALEAITYKPIQPQMVMQESGLNSISDAVFSVSLFKEGVTEDVIAWRLLEDVSLRESVIKMYESGTVKLDI
jgi:hypothetical protein